MLQSHVRTMTGHLLTAYLLIAYLLIVHRPKVQHVAPRTAVCIHRRSYNTTTYTRKHSVALRAGTTDMHVFKQIFVEHFLQDMVMAAPKNTEYILVRCIVDFHIALAFI